MDKVFLEECLNYSPETGELTWKCRPLHHFTSDITMKRWNGRYAGKTVGRIDSTGYLQIHVSGKHIQAQRAVWTMVNGHIPEDMVVDHVDGNRLNNRLNNLRLASKRQNSWNQGIRRNNTSGTKGISFNKRSGKWCAHIMAAGVTLEKRFEHREDAEVWLKDMRENKHNEYARHE